MEEVGRFALKLEKYRYNLITSISWVIFGSIFSAAIMVLSALLLLGFGRYAVLTLIPAAIVSFAVFHRIRKVISPADRGMWRWECVFFTIPFLVFYLLLPNFLHLSNLQAFAYFSTAWYPSLGVAFVLVGAFIERRDEMLVTKMRLPAGILILLMSAPLELVCMEVKSFCDVVAAGLIATALMLSIYTACALYGFFRGHKALF